MDWNSEDNTGFLLLSVVISFSFHGAIIIIVSVQRDELLYIQPFESVGEFHFWDVLTLPDLLWFITVAGLLPILLASLLARCF